jgi:hypothetical protein
MKNRNTSCEKCYFSQEATSNKSCEFYIPDVLSSKKNIQIINNYNYINDYVCRYGVSKKAAEEIIENDIDIKEYTKIQVSPKYLLFCIDYKDDSLLELCENIKKLCIQPGCVSIVFHHDHDAQNSQSICDNVLGKTIPWKLHKFLEPKKDYEIFNACTSTDQRLTKNPYVWIVNNRILTSAVENDSINKINFIINLEQPDISILNSKVSNDYFTGIFLTIENIKGIVTHISPDIGEVIKDMYLDSIAYYD